MRTVQPVRTPSETPSSTPSETSSEMPSANDVDALGQLMQAAQHFAAAGSGIVELFRVGNGTRTPLKKYDAAEFDPFFIGDEHGEGRYFAQLKSMGGKYIKGATFYARPQSGPQSIAQAQRAQPPAESPMVQTLLTMMMQQAQQSQQQLTSILTALITKPQDGIRAADLLPLLKQEKSDVGQLIGGLRELQQLAPAGGGGSSESSDLADLAKLATVFAPMLQQQQPPRRVVVGPRYLPAGQPIHAPRTPPLTVATTPAVEPKTPPQAPAAIPPASAPVDAPIGHQVVNLLRVHSHYMIAANITAAGLFELIDAAPDGGEYATLLSIATDDQIVQQLAASLPEVASSSRVDKYVREVLGKLREMIADAQSAEDDDDEEGASDGTQLNSESLRVDAAA